jgi:hypothetical protein
MAKTMAKSVTKARSRQKPNLVTSFEFLEHCFENKLAGRTHSVYGQKDAKISYKSKKSPKPETRNTRPPVSLLLCDNLKK